MSHFTLPEYIHTDKGDVRRVGFEIEYAGIDFKEGVNLLQSIVDGEIKKDSAFSYKINSPKYGEFIVEVDAAVLKQGRYKDYLADIGINPDDVDLNDKIDEIINKVATTVVPSEIVMPPIAMTELEIADDIVTSLRKHDAEGTRASIFYAFGLHINAEIVCVDARYLLDHIRAFIILFDWICKTTDVDFSRRLAPYIKPYPDDYQKLVLDEKYKPDLNSLIGDYLKLVGSRNFALDMLPIFAHIDKDRVLAKAKQPDLINARPAFHYRLANSLIDEEGWCISKEWEIWLLIESLAGDKKALSKLSSDYLKHHFTKLIHFTSNWVEHVENVFIR